jgi:hypothetical protein
MKIITEDGSTREIVKISNVQDLKSIISSGYYNEIIHNWSKQNINTKSEELNGSARLALIVDLYD